MLPLRTKKCTFPSLYQHFPSSGFAISAKYKMKICKAEWNGRDAAEGRAGSKMRLNALAFKEDCVWNGCNSFWFWALSYNTKHCLLGSSQWGPRAGGNHSHVAPDVRCTSPPSPTATEIADIGRREELHSVSSKSPSVSSAPLAMQDAKSAEEEQGDILWGNSYQLIGNKSWYPQSFSRYFFSNW